jgi:GAF domain-containing protein
LLKAPTFDGDEEKTRTAGLLNAVLLFVLVAGLTLPVLASVVDPQTLAINALTALVLGVGALGMLLLLRRGRVHLASILFSALILGMVTMGVMFFGGIRSATAKSYLLVIVMAGLLLGWRGALVFGLLSTLSASAAFYAERTGLIDPPPEMASVGDFVILVFIFVLMAIVLGFALRTIAGAILAARQAAGQLAESNRELQAAQASLEKRTTSLQAATDVSSDIAEVLDPEELVRRVVDLVRERFGLYYVGLFLVQEAESEGDAAAVLHAGTGDAGAQLVAQGYRLPVGGNSMIGQCVATGKAGVELNLYRAPIRPTSALLPDAGSELALPLRSRGRVIGAMSIQSTQVAAFDSDDIIIMQTLADQVASAIDNARLYAEAQEAAARSERVVRRYVQESWDTLVEAEPQISEYRYTPGRAGGGAQSGPVDAQRAWMSSLDEAVRDGSLSVQDAPDGASLAVPLVLNGVVIGAVGLRRPSGQTWNADEQALARSVSEQMTQALENRRLFQVARERARRELVLRQTTDRVRAQADLDAVLQTAAQEMRRIVGATHVAIRLRAAASARGEGEAAHGEYDA